MIGIGRVKRCRIAKGGDNGPAQGGRCRVESGARGTALGRVPHENGAGIAWAAIAELPLRVGRVDCAQKQVQKPVIGQDFGIIGDLDHLEMAGAACHDRAVIRIGDGAASEAGDDIDHAVNGFEIGLHAPKTTACQYRCSDIGGMGAHRLQQERPPDGEAQTQGLDEVDP